MNRVLAVSLALLMVGVAVAPASAGALADPSLNRADAASLQNDAPPDPENDTVGWVNGYWHNESIDVDQSDGLSPSEREALVARSMARVEYIRNLEFRENVSVTVRNRSEYQRQRNDSNTSARFDAWNNQVWEAMLVVGENADANEVLDSLYGGSVAGYYAPGTDELVVVSADGELTINGATLVHELTHALQDQYHNLSAPRFSAATQDGDLAASGIVEGEAGYVEARYDERCGEAWSCVDSPASGGGSMPANYGMYLTIYQPYSDGPAYVDALRERGGWAAVNESMMAPPNSTEQTIHDTAEKPVEVEFTDTARDGWERFPEQGENGADTLGEASVFAGFWYQSQAYDAGIVDTSRLGAASGPYDTYNYSAPPSAGWAGDGVLPYRNNDTVENGYVWVTRWDTAEDAREFERAYLDALDTHGATEVANDTYVVPGGDFADAFHVQRTDTRVRIVNGPSVGAVNDIRPDTEPAGNTTLEPIPTSTTASGPTPGFGALAALAAVLMLSVYRLPRGDSR